MTRPVLVLGTRNPKKRDEMIELLDIPAIELCTIDAYPGAPEVIEDQGSFAGNATKKAVELARSLGHWVLGEDSGLCVDALQGRPGVHSARYAGEPCDDSRNNQRLVAELMGVIPEERTAHYICHAVVADPSGAVRASAEGRCDGRIAMRPRGCNGFGYDPLFLITEQNYTLGELPAETKRRISHRSAAMALLRPQLLDLLAGGGWR